MQAKDILGNPIQPGDQIAFGDRHWSLVATIEEVRYMDRQDGRNRIVAPQFASCFNLRVSPIVCTASFACQNQAGDWVRMRDVRGHDHLTPELKTISVDKVYRVVKL